MRIGEVASRAGVTRRALRLYEEHGLLAPVREANGYREYDESSLTRVRNIRFLVEAGLTLADTMKFMNCLDGDIASSTPCPPGIAVVKERLVALSARIDELATTRSRLSALLDEATGTGLTRREAS